MQPPRARGARENKRKSNPPSREARPSRMANREGLCVPESSRRLQFEFPCVVRRPEEVFLAPELFLRVPSRQDEERERDGRSVPATKEREAPDLLHDFRYGIIEFQ